MTCWASCRNGKQWATAEQAKLPGCTSDSFVHHDEDGLSLSARFFLLMWTLYCTYVSPVLLLCVDVRWACLYEGQSLGRHRYRHRGAVDAANQVQCQVHNIRRLIRAYPRTQCSSHRVVLGLILCITPLARSPSSTSSPCERLEDCWVVRPSHSAASFPCRSPSPGAGGCPLERCHSAALHCTLSLLFSSRFSLSLSHPHNLTSPSTSFSLLILHLGQFQQQDLGISLWSCPSAPFQARRRESRRP